MDQPLYLSAHQIFVSTYPTYLLVYIQKNFYETSLCSLEPMGVVIIFLICKV
jgi:hypothetical protein